MQREKKLQISITQKKIPPKSPNHNNSNSNSKNMPESRDRLVREDPPTPILGRRSSEGFLMECESERVSYLSPSRFSNGGSGGRNLFGTTPLQSTTRLVSEGPAMRLMEISAASRSISRGNRNLYRSIPLADSGNRRLRRGGNFRNYSPLPGWFPRTPLRDITGVVNAIERRRSRVREHGHHRLGNPSSHEEPSASDPNPSATDAPLEHKICMTTPAAIKGCPPPGNYLPNMFSPNHGSEESCFLTPQKKLLNSIDEVEKIVMEEFRRMKRSPAAKKAERERKVRTLMAMR